MGQNLIGPKILKKDILFWLFICNLVDIMFLSYKEYMGRPYFFLLKLSLALNLGYAFINWILNYAFVKWNIFLNGIWFSLTLQNLETNIVTEFSYFTKQYSYLHRFNNNLPYIMPRHNWANLLCNEDHYTQYNIWGWFSFIHVRQAHYKETRIVLYVWSHYLQTQLKNTICKTARFAQLLRLKLVHNKAF